MLEDTGVQSIAGWATAISPGPANESTQTVSFTAVADIPGLFAVQPVIAPTEPSPIQPPRTPMAPPPSPSGARQRRHRKRRERTAPRVPSPSPSRPSTTPRASPQALTKQTAKTTAPNQPRAQRPRSRLDLQTSPRRASASPSPATTPHSSPSNRPLHPTEHSRTPPPNANGLATLTITAVDNGGTANGGTNTSVPRTLTITVDPVNDAPTFSPGSDQSVVSLLGARPSQARRRASQPGRRTSPPRTSPSPSRAPTQGSSQSNRR